MADTWRAADPFGAVVEIDDNISAFLQKNGARWCEHVIDPKLDHPYSVDGVYRTCWRRDEGRVPADADPKKVIETLVYFDDRGFRSRALLGKWLRERGYDPDHDYSDAGKTDAELLCDWIRKTEERLLRLERSV